MRRDKEEIRERRRKRECVHGISGEKNEIMRKIKRRSRRERRKDAAKEERNRK